MTPTGFKECNKVLGAPQGMTSEEVMNLPIFTDGKSCTSVWELNDEDLAEIIKTKKIALTIYSGATQPPVALGVIKSDK